MAAGKVAIVAIHGVGDPKPGDTALSVSRLLVAHGAYRHEGSDTWIVPVAPAHPVPGAQGLDQGLRVHESLLEGTVLTDAEKTYAAERHRLKRKAGPDVDVVDLYWGDLSGLHTTGTRIATELYVLGLRLAQLGRETVQHLVDSGQAPKQHGFALQLVASGQRFAADMLTKPVVLLNVLLLLTCLWWMVLKQLEEAPLWLRAVQFASVAIALVAGIASLYPKASRSLAVLAVAMAGVAFAAWKVPAPLETSHVTGLLALAWALLLGAVFAAFVRFYDVRVPKALWWARVLAACLAIVVIWGYLRAPANKAASPDLPAHWQFIGPHVMEVISIALVACWLAMGFATAIVVLAGSWLKHRAKVDAVTRAVDTGRYGMYGSVMLFLVFTIGLWTLFMPVLLSGLYGIEYTPILQKSGATAYRLTEDYYNKTVQGLSWVALQLTVLMAAAFVLLAPSVHAELFVPAAGTAGRPLGHWLSRGGYFFARNASRFAFLAALLLAVLAWARVAVEFGAALPWAAKLADPTSRAIETASAVVNWVAVATAGSAVGLLLLGSRIFGRLSKLRLPLDAALDVDNHFRAFPWHRTPRGRIAARMTSVLRSLVDAQYDRIVIVSHSQGTVISADLLRYLKKADPAFFGPVDVRLFTCGSPLRQLYAARFPSLYPWVVASNGPSCGDLGVSRWTNAYCTGDYVGRWLWLPDAGEPLDTGTNLDTATCRQVCLGRGAHTHYYDVRMKDVAGEIDALVK